MMMMMMMTMMMMMMMMMMMVVMMDHEIDPKMPCSVLKFTRPSNPSL